MALQFSIEDLIQRANGPCGFYLITCKESLSPEEFSRRHAYMLKLMRNAVRKKNLIRHAGVRVFEEGEKTYRMHAHWVLTPRMTQDTVQHYADFARLGHVWLDFRPATPFLGMYLSKYLTKAKGKMHGVRRWACFGELDGVRVADIEIDSPEVNLYRSHMKACLADGLHGVQAHVECIRRCNLSKYGHQFRGTEQAARPCVDSVVEVEKVDRTYVRRDGHVQKVRA